MTPALLLPLVLLGQQSCLTRTYRVQQQARAYTTYQTYAYAQPVQYQERLVWVAVEGNGSADYQAADLVGSRQRSLQQAGARVAYQQAVVDQLAGIRAELAAIKLAAGTGVDPGPPIPPTQPPTNPPPPVGPGQPPPNPDPNQPPSVPKPEVDPAVAKQWTDDAIAVLSARCIKCHGGDKPKKDFRIFDPAGNLALQSPASIDMINRAILTQKMPPTKPLSDEEAGKVGLWVGLHDEEINAFIKGLLGKPPAAAPPPPVVPGQGVIRQ